MGIKDLVKGRTVTFEYYYDSCLWYSVDEKDFLFPVPIEDIGTAKFMAKDKAMLYMRYIRKYLDKIEE